MPIFDYRCEACGHVFDVLQAASGPPPAACPECGGARLTKLLSAPHIHRHSGGSERMPVAGLGQGAGVRPRAGHSFDAPAAHSHGHGHDHQHGHKHGQKD